MTPDMRSLSVLSVDILLTSPRWMIIAGDRSFGFPPKDFLRVVALGFNTETARCYPCKAEAPFDPLPWPMLEGEEEIEAFTDFVQTFGQTSSLVRMLNTDFSVGWYLAVFTDDEINHASEDVSRDGYHPAPRQGGKWVWEANQ